MTGNPRAVDGEGLHQEFDVRFLRPYFTHHREDFVAMLEALAQNIAAYDAIPNAVFQRLKGEDPELSISFIWGI